MRERLSYRPLPIPERKSFFASPTRPLPKNGTIYEEKIPPITLDRIQRFSIGNPNYRQDQRLVLDQLHVEEAETALPAPLRIIFDRLKGKLGHTVVKLKDRREVKIDNAENGITTIRQMKRLTPWWLPLPIYKVEDFYHIDQLTGKAWDVSQLWSPLLPEYRKTKRVEVLTIPPILNAFYAPLESINLFMLNRLSTDSIRGRGLTENPKFKRHLEIVDHLIPGHEAGHRWQFREFFPLEDIPQRPKWINLKLFFLPLIEKIFPNWAKEIKDELTTFKETHVQMERNAHAFALAAARKLKEQGVDLLRGFNVKEIESGVDLALGSYDRGKIGRLPGIPFSQKYRKQFRQHGTLPS